MVKSRTQILQDDDRSLRQTDSRFPAGLEPARPGTVETRLPPPANVPRRQGKSGFATSDQFGRQMTGRVKAIQSPDTGLESQSGDSRVA